MKPVEVVPSSTGGDRLGRDRFVFRVESIAGGIARAKDKGGKLLRGPDEVPGGDWVAHVEDPEGVSFQLVSTKK